MNENSPRFNIAILLSKWHLLKVSVSITLLSVMISMAVAFRSLHKVTVDNALFVVLLSIPYSWLVIYLLTYFFPTRKAITSKKENRTDTTRIVPLGSLLGICAGVTWGLTAFFAIAIDDGSITIIFLLPPIMILMLFVPGVVGALAGAVTFWLLEKYVAR